MVENDISELENMKFTFLNIILAGVLKHPVAVTVMVRKGIIGTVWKIRSQCILTVTITATSRSSLPHFNYSNKDCFNIMAYILVQIMKNKELQLAGSFTVISIVET